MPAPRVTHYTLDERRARGKAARAIAPLAAHTGWEPTAGRPDPVTLLESQNLTREPDLVPVRHGRMMVSPFTFYRGAAKIMSSDLANLPTAGLDVQLCGDAHLSNFGGFASPERNLLFDLNDFDETLPGPFEYDVKRLAASFVIAARNNGHSVADARDATLACVRGYRESALNFAAMRTMDVWYSHLDEERLGAWIRQASKEFAKEKKEPKKTAKKDESKEQKRFRSTVEKARTRDSVQALSKLGEVVDGRYRIVSNPPIVVPFRELAAAYGLSPDEVSKAIHEQFREYRSTLQPDRRHLLERFQVVDGARKVVGVGSVGTRAFIVLLQGRDQDDPLFLQVKEATSSVLEDHLPRSKYKNPGERVVQGQLLMQAASDIFLGWTKGLDQSRYFYWRQLRDGKTSAPVDTMTPEALVFYAGICGWTLARAHARSGDVVALAAYLGKRDTFDRSILDFAERYADQNERDYEAFSGAIASGRIEAVEGV